jgi:signal transduction histidine kinase
MLEIFTDKIISFSNNINPYLLATITIGALALVAGLFVLLLMSVYRKNKIIEKSLAKRKEEEEGKQNMYEFTILNELSSKMDYSLNVQNIAESISVSMEDFIDHSAVFYMLLFPEKIVFKGNLNKSVSRKFIDEVEAKMFDSLAILIAEDFKKKELKENMYGASINEQFEDSLGSFFNIPLVSAGKVVGLLTVADTRVGFYKDKKTDILYKVAREACQAVDRLQALVASENSRLNAMVKSMTDGVVMIDMDYSLLVASPAAKKAMGFESKSNLSMSDFINDLNKKFDIKDKFEESVRFDKTFVSDEVSLPGGFFKIIISVVRESDKPLGYVIVFRDINREKEVERIKEDFTSMIVHELRSPLDSIKKMAELMRVSQFKKDKQEECLQMIYSNSSDMLELINNLLDIAKIEAGKFEIMKQKSDIKKIIESRILFFGTSAKDVKVNLASYFAKDIPDNIEFDPHTISQVLNNLISNAIKFTKENGNVTVQVVLHKNDGNIIEEGKGAGINWFINKNITNIPDSLFVAVTDNGIGIAPDQIGKLFNKFIQAKSTFVAKEGTGLGLAIIKSIIDSHGGIVGVESVEGQGTTFYFTLPIS